MTKWICTKCGFDYDGSSKPKKCSKCGATFSN